jgi:curved DNA-binding protein CbpA
MNHYRTLGVARDASRQEIKDAYRRLVRQHHPDANPDDNGVSEALMKQVLTAYATLSDPHKRTRYDADVRLQASDDTPEERPSTVTHHAPTYANGASGPPSLMGKVRVALGDSPDVFAAKLGLSEMALASFEARDAMPNSAIQLRTFTHLVELAAKNLEMTGKTVDAIALRTAFNRKKANRNIFR